MSIYGFGELLLVFLGNHPFFKFRSPDCLGAHPILVPEKDTWPRSSQSECSIWAGLWGQWLGQRWVCDPFKTMNDELLSRSPFSPLGWLRGWDISLKVLGLSLLLQGMSSWGENQRNKRPRYGTVISYHCLSSWIKLWLKLVLLLDLLKMWANTLPWASLHLKLRDS